MQVHCSEVRVPPDLVLTVLYRVAASMRSRPGHGSRLAVPLTARKPVHYAKPALKLL
jgi:hypothetical protein